MEVPKCHAYTRWKWRCSKGRCRLRVEKWKAQLQKCVNQEAPTLEYMKPGICALLNTFASLLDADGDLAETLVPSNFL